MTAPLLDREPPSWWVEPAPESLPAWMADSALVPSWAPPDRSGETCVTACSDERECSRCLPDVAWGVPAAGEGSVRQPDATDVARPEVLSAVGDVATALTALDALADLDREEAQLYARRQHLLADLVAACDRAEQPAGSLVVELAGTCRIGQGAAATQIEHARLLTQVLPQALDLLESGLLPRNTALLLLRRTQHCTDEVRAEVDRRALPELAALNAADAHRVLEVLVPQVEAEIDAELTRQRHLEAVRARRVWKTDDGNGTTSTTFVHDSLLAHEHWVALDALVRAEKAKDRKDGRRRTVDQIRADLLVRLPGLVLALVRAIQSGDLYELVTLAHDEEALRQEGARRLAAHERDLLDQVLRDQLPIEDPPVDDALLPAEDDGRGCEGYDDPGEAREGAGPVDDGAGVGRFAEPPDDWPDPPPPLNEAERCERDLLLQALRFPVPRSLVLNVHVPMTTLLDLDERSATLPGFGALAGWRARMLLPVSGLRQIAVEARTGQPIHLDDQVLASFGGKEWDDQPPSAEVRARLLQLIRPVVVAEAPEPQHDPSRLLAELVRVRDPFCIGIACSCPSPRCDLDHDVRHPDGPTAAWNLTPKSRRDHRLKHNGWACLRHEDGSVSWTSPLGRTYTRPSMWTAH